MTEGEGGGGGGNWDWGCAGRGGASVTGVVDASLTTVRRGAAHGCTGWGCGERDAAARESARRERC